MTEKLSKLDVIKELLRIADELAPSNKYDDIGRVQDILYDLFDSGDLDWLVEQAERVEDLERKLELKKKQHKYQRDEKNAFLLENARLREALEFYADEKDYEHEISYDMAYLIGGDILSDGGEKARQALAK